MPGQKAREARRAPQPKMTGTEVIDPPKERPKIHGKKIEVAPAPKPEKSEKELGTQEQYDAVMLHSSLREMNDLRRRLMAKEQEIVNLRAENGRLLVTVETVKISEAERQMDDLVKEHGMTPGRTINKDDDTGEITWRDAALAK